MNHPQTTVCRRDQPAPAKAGIALIIVLGFLAVLIMLGVAFIVMSRTERLAAEVGKESFQAKYLLDGAVDAALDGINEALWTSTRKYPHAPKSLMIIESVDSGDTLQADGLDLISGEVTNWLPRRFLAKAGDPGYDADYDASLVAKNAEWIYVKDPVESPSRILGRFAYVCVDCSGMLDANLVNANPKRGLGTNILTEIDYAFLPEIGSVQDRLDMVDNLKKYHRFAGIPEILHLNDSRYKTVDEPGVRLDAVNNRLLNSLAPYSLSHDRGWFDWNNEAGQGADRWVVGKWPGEVPVDVRSWNMAQAQEVFAALYPADHPEIMARCFIDFADADLLPGAAGSTADTEIPCCEPIPMINEIMLRHSLRREDLKVTYTHIWEVEVWYPFPGNFNSHRYKLKLNLDAGNYIPMIQGLSGPAASSRTIVFKPEPEPIVAADAEPATFTVDPAHPFMVITSRYNFVYTLTNGLNAEDFPIRVRSQVRVQGVRGKAVLQDLNEGSVQVDSANPPDRTIGPTEILSLDSLAMHERVSNVRYAYAACNDPRLNHDRTDWDVPAAVTHGAINSLPDFNKSENGDIEGTDMFARTNAVDIETVAELGYISRGKPWTTIDLFTTPGQKLLARFRAKAGSTNALSINTNNQYGLVNPASLYTNALMAVFRDTPIERYPGEPSPAAWNDAGQVGRLVDAIRNKASSDSSYGSASMDSAAGWVVNDALKAGGVLSILGLSNNQKESIIRNSYRLFNANQNLYTVIVVAQSIKDADKNGLFNKSNDTVSGEKRAVALVWRNPFPDEDGHFEAYIRLFKYLTD